MTASGWRSYHFGSTWISFALTISQRIRLPIQSCLLLHSLWASLGHSLTMWLIVSSVLLHIPHSVWSSDLSIIPWITIARRACSWVAYIKLSVSRFRVPFRNYCHLSWLPASLVCLKNWPCNGFSFQEIAFSFFFCFLASVEVSRIGSMKAISTDLEAVRTSSLNSFT